MTKEQQEHFDRILLDFAALSRLESRRFQEALSRIGGPGVSSLSSTFAHSVLKVVVILLKGAGK